MQLHAVNLCDALAEGRRDAPEPLARTGRHSVLGECLYRGQVGEPGGGGVGERSVPARLVPPGPPPEERARDVDRVDLKRAVEEPARCRGVAQALEIGKRRLARMRDRRRESKVGFEDGEKTDRTKGYHPRRIRRPLWLQPVEMKAELHVHGQSSDHCAIRRWRRRVAIQLPQKRMAGEASISNIGEERIVIEVKRGSFLDVERAGVTEWNGKVGSG